MNNENLDLLKAYEGYADVYEKYKNKPDVLKMYRNYPEIFRADEPVRIMVGREMHESFNTFILGELNGESRAEMNSEGYYECNVSPNLNVYIEALMSSEHHPRSLKVSLHRIDDEVKERYIAKTDELLEKMKSEGVF